jgi:hypothetical protein
MFTIINSKPSKSAQPGVLHHLATLGLRLLSAMVIVWLLPCSLFAQTVIGGEIPDSSAILDLQSSDKGFLLPRVTQAQRDAIQLPAAGLMIYNTTTFCVDVNFGTPADPQWLSLRCRQGIILRVAKFWA